MRDYLELREVEVCHDTGAVLDLVLVSSTTPDLAHQRARQPVTLATRAQVARHGLYLLQTLFRVVGINMHELQIRSVIGLAVHATRPALDSSLRGWASSVPIQIIWKRDFNIIFLSHCTLFRTSACPPYGNIFLLEIGLEPPGEHVRLVNPWFIVP